MKSKELYVVHGAHLDLSTGQMSHITPSVCTSEDKAKKALREVYDYHRTGYYDVPDEVADENGDSIPGGYCYDDEAHIYACAEFACDCLVEVASFIISKVEI